MLTDREMQTLRNLGNEAEAAADEIDRLNALRRELQTEREQLLERCARAGMEARMAEGQRWRAALQALVSALDHGDSLAVADALAGAEAVLRA